MINIQKHLQTLTNEQYHADREYLSSSAFKLILTGPDKFVARYVNNESESITSPALTFGTVAHLAVLEPHLYDENVRPYPGNIRRGKEWDLFVQENPGKLILTKPEMDKLDCLMEQYKNNEIAQGLIANTQKELALPAMLQGIKVKCKCDAIDIDRGIIIDLKTTSYYGDRESFAGVVRQLYYHLSASLYCQIAESFFGKPFSFYFIVMSKSGLTCSVYKLSNTTAAEGSVLLQSSFDTYNRYLLTGSFEDDTIIEIEEV